MITPMDLLVSGTKMGRWTLIARSTDPAPIRKWLCVCQCGTSRTVDELTLRQGRSRSCGCLKRELLASRMKVSALTHGDSHGCSEYKIWAGMIQRCCNPRNAAFRNYGGRGIKVHEEWRRSYTSFLRDVGRRPSPKHTIERIDNDGGYVPGNVCWATRQQQGCNRRGLHFLTFDGATRTLEEWTRLKGFKHGTVARRLKLGWGVERALTRQLFSRHESGTNAANRRWGKQLCA